MLILRVVHTLFSISRACILLDPVCRSLISMGQNSHPRAIFLVWQSEQHIGTVAAY
jgi:hypothetical protein